MSLSSKKTSESFQNHVNGFYGTFITNAGRIDYLETKASLSLGGHSNETRLTKFLLPVREALPAADMDFNQLLQRDLDDHRVATELVPYLLNPHTSGPAFFPPVVAAMLPFQNFAPRDLFEGDKRTSTIEDHLGNWKTFGFGRAFRFDALLTEELAEHELKLGRLHWNDELCKLVVLDGQHRAMALLAIHRTLTSSWSGTAEKYKSFYESAVNDALSGCSEEQKQKICSAIELPVTIIWFPELAGESSSNQIAARKLFVDVNKNARKPSASRLLLLSDRDLPSIFVRASLNKFRSGSSFPIYAVEYDHPDSDEQAVSKWSVITNAGNLSSCVRRLLMGPPKYFGMQSKFGGGQDSKSELGDTLRGSLDALDTLPNNEEEDGVLYKRDELNAENFAPKRVHTLTEQYNSGWGQLIEKMFLQITPYAVHALALKQLYDGWTTADAASRLAKDAIFEGVGVFWTLREGEKHWKDLNSEREQRGLAPAPKTDVITAWEILTAKQSEFRKIRSELYLGLTSKERESEAAFEMFKTVACQIGLVLAVRALWAVQPDQTFNKIPAFIDSCVLAINAALNAGRKPFMIKDAEVMGKRFNMLDKLDSNKSVHFRYFWIQLLDTPEATLILQDSGFDSSVSELASNGRVLYRRELINNVARALQRIDQSISKSAHEKTATTQVDKELQQALKKWFAIESEKYKEWVLAIARLESVATSSDNDDNLIDGTEGSSGQTISTINLSQNEVDELISENKKMGVQDDF
jgi:hypothetical protein